MAKVYNRGVYVDIDPASFEKPHEDLAYFVNGRRYKFVLCHFEECGTLRGYNTHAKSWYDLFPNYIQKDSFMPVGATLIEGIF